MYWEFSTKFLQTVVFGTLAGLIVFLLLRRRRYNMPPGPWSWPIIGNIFQLGSDERYYIKFYEWSKLYGPIITVKLGVMKIIVVSNLESAMEVLVKKSTDFAGRQESPSIRRASQNYKDLAISPYGPTWKLHRRVTTTALRHFMKGEGLERRIHTALRTTCNVLEKQTEPFNPDEVLTFLVANILMGLNFQGEFAYGDPELKYIIEKDDELHRAFNNLVPEDIIPGLQYVYTSNAMETIDRTLKDIMNGFINRKFAAERDTFTRDNIRHLTDSLLLAREVAGHEYGESPEYLSDEYLTQTLFDIFIGGINTTRYTLGFIILHMVAFPEIQRKVQEEIDREVGRDRMPRLADRSNLSYTHAVLRESMRIATVLPSGVLHRTTCDTQIDKYKIPKGTLVMINHWALHHDPYSWDEVDKFKPERFLDEKGRLGPKPPNWLPFSAGKRVCLGEFVAKPEIHLLFATLMQQFSWVAEEGVRPDISPGGSLMFAYPKPYKLLVSKRL